MVSFSTQEQQIFDQFIKNYKLTESQSEQFKLYLSLLLTARKQFNLTSISSIIDSIDYHFRDSLALADCMDLNAIKMIADIGTGGGFPGIPLKIYFPHLVVVLIEVNAKKREFLDQVIVQLGLENIEISGLDWRTFLRKARYPIDLFVTRASLHTDELIRVFRPSCYFQDATLVYWASQHWTISPQEQPFLLKECDYTIEHKNRKLVFFKEKH